MVVERPARHLRGGGRPHGGAAGRRSRVLFVPAATFFDSGLPAILDVLPEVVPEAGDRA